MCGLKACCWQTNPVRITRQTPVGASIDPDIKEQFQSFGSVKGSNKLSLSPFIICACAMEDPQLISEGMALVADAFLTHKSPGLTEEVTEGVVDVLKTFTGEVATAKGFQAPNMVRNAAAGLANVASIGEAYRKAVGSDGAVELYLDWLLNTQDEHAVSAVCRLLSEVCKNNHNRAEFLEQNGMAAVTAVLKTSGVVPERFENALAIIVSLCQAPDKAAHKALMKAEWIPLILQVMVAHKTANSARSHQKGVTALHWLLQHDSREGHGKYRAAMVDSGITRVLLSCLMPRVTTSNSADVIGLLLTDLLHTAPEGDSIPADLVSEGLPKISFVMSEFLSMQSTLTIYMGVIAGLCSSAENKAAIQKAELIESVVTAMLEHDDDVRMEEQACRTLCEVSRGEESVKDYMADVLEDSFFHGFNLIETILDSVANYVEDVDYIEAACSASWSVAFKNAKMKTKAAEAGVFETLSKVIKVHMNQPDVLPHCFAAISNLVANHEPNQLSAGSGGVIGTAVECLETYRDHPMMCLTILTTLKSIMSGQHDNMDKFEECRMSRGISEEGTEIIITGPALAVEVTEIFADPQDEIEGNILELSGVVTDMIASRKEAIEQKNKKADAGKIPRLEYLETQNHPLKAVNADQKSRVVKKGMMMVQHHSQKEPTYQLCILYPHELVCFDDPEKSKTMRPMETYQLALLSKLEVLSSDRTKLNFETCNVKKGGVAEGGMLQGSTATETEVWLEALQELLPEKTETVQAWDAKKPQTRLISWQYNTFFMFGEVKKIWTVKRAFMADSITDVKYDAKKKSFSFKHVHSDDCLHGEDDTSDMQGPAVDEWVFVCKDAKIAMAWEEFAREQVADSALTSERDKIEREQKQSRAEAQQLETATFAAHSEAEGAWYEEEADRRLVAMLANDDSIEESAELEEFSRMEIEAAQEEEARKEEQARRQEQEAQKLMKEEERQQALADLSDQKSYRAYCEALMRELAETQRQVEEITKKNEPMAEALSNSQKLAADTDADYVDMKQEFDKLLGGRLGQVCFMRPCHCPPFHLAVR